MSARAQIEVTASSNRLTQGLAAARAKVMKWAGAVGRGIKAVSSNSTVGNVLGNLQSKATDFAIDAAKGVIDLERNLTRFQIAAGKTPESMNAMRKSISSISKETAIGSADILAGAQTYVDLTGDVAGAEKAMRSFSRIAQASGSSVSDIATATASMQMSMKLDSGDIENAFSGLISQGKMGAVSLKDMAAELSTLGPMMAKFKGGTGLEGIKTMGAAFQVVRQGAGSASEANTQLQSVITGIVSHAKQFEKAGVKIYDKDPKTGVKSLKPFAQIIEGISKSKLMKDPTALGKAFGRVEALAAFQSLAKNRDLYDELIAKGADASAVQKDLDTYLNSTAGKLDTAMNQLKVSIAEAFTPERIAGFVAAVQQLVDLLIKAVGFAEQLGSKIDYEGAIGKKVEQDEVARAGKMTDVQKRARADELDRKAEALSRSDALGARGAREGMRSAAKKLRTSAGSWGVSDGKSPGFDATQAQAFFGAVSAQMDDAKKNPKAAAAAVGSDTIAGQILAELKKLNANGGKPTTIVADGNKIAKTTANATDNRRGI